MAIDFDYRGGRSLVLERGYLAGVLPKLDVVPINKLLCLGIVRRTGVGRRPKCPSEPKI